MLRRREGEFKSLAVSVIDDIGKMITKMLMLNAYQIRCFSAGRQLVRLADGGYTGDGAKYSVARCGSPWRVGGPQSVVRSRHAQFPESAYLQQLHAEGEAGRWRCGKTIPRFVFAALC